MHKIIQFRSALDSFNDNEFELFCQKLYQTYDKKEIVIKSLFFLALHEFKQNRYDHVNKMNQINTDILDLRRTKKKSTTRTEITATNKIEPNTNVFKLTPSTIISHIATFLQTSELSTFIKCNRYIYISCVSIPTTMQEFNRINPFLDNLAESCRLTQTRKLSQFRMVKKVSLSVPDIGERNFGLNGIDWVWKKLKVLSVHNIFGINNANYSIRKVPFPFSLSNKTPKDEVYVPPINVFINIIQNMELKQLLLDNIRFNECVSFGGQEQNDLINLREMDLFVTILSAAAANRALEYLSIGNVTGNRIYLSRDDIRSKLKSVNLTGLRALALLKCSDIEDELLCLISNQLCSLHIESSYGETRNPFLFMQSSHSNVQHTKLQELCVSNVRLDAVSNILKTAINVRRIHYGGPTYNRQILECMIQELGYLEYLSLVAIQDWDLITEPLRNASKRKNMKIRIKYSGLGNILRNLKYIENNLVEFISVLSESVSNDFLFECFFEVDRTSNEHMKVKDELLVGMNSKLEQLKNKYLVAFINKTVVDFEGFVISNKNNSMNGYSERWLYTCEKCSYGNHYFPIIIQHFDM